MHKISVTITDPTYGNLTTSSLTFRVGNNFVFLPILSNPAPPLGTWTNIFTDNFEGAFPGAWQIYDNSSGGSGAYAWGKRTCKPYQGSNSAWAVGGGSSGKNLGCSAKYPVNQEPWMIYGPFSLQDAKGAELLFKYWINTEANYDYLCWYASVDESYFYGSCLSGNSSGWADGVFDLNNVYTIGSLAGQSQVWVAFAFSSDSINTFTGGAYIDNVTLRKCTSISGCTGSLALKPAVNSNLIWKGVIKSLAR